MVTLCLGTVFLGSAALQGELAGPGSYVAVAANYLPLLWVHRNPLAVVLVFAVTYPLWLAFPFGDTAREGHVLQSLPTLLALYATGAWDRPLWLRSVSLVTPTWMFAASAFGLWKAGVDEIVYVATVMVFVWALGVVDSRRREHAADLEVRTKQLEEARHALAEQAVSDERARIARELHDVVAHAMSVITVQAGVGGHLMEQQPERAREALAVIERTGREALAEMRRMLIVLRPDNRHLSDAGPPQPGLAGLEQLVDNARAAGLRVSLTLRGELPPLSPGLDLTAFRVLQEGLTNATKHAPGSRVEVQVEYDHGRLRLGVEDHGPGAAAGFRHGQGLRGMAERVALYDGELELITSSSGFAVRAVIPVEGSGSS